MAKEFIWNLDSQLPRQGPMLEKGKAHKASDYPAHVVEFWVKSGAAEWVEDKSKVKVKEKE